MSVPCYGAVVRYSHLVHCKLCGDAQTLCLLCHQRCANVIPATQSSLGNVQADIGCGSRGKGPDNTRD